MTDDELMATFENNTIAPAAFSHERHVRVAWLLPRMYGAVDGFERLVVGITSMVGWASRMLFMSRSLAPGSASLCW
ncbi:hypothetical protein I6E74_04925 [Salinibacterium sp. SWN139]|uniref:hypothetical protein n=1 Tax=Salinibacterium sp. SWN139 TaxID=2792055 RepID=UPI0018CEA64F|nr:hypothetical protein [Salinibacterium sp. SWN139]MBH0053515.1 hypothetical protein [Salinibacterium sp. SWN139]